MIKINYDYLQTNLNLEKYEKKFEEIKNAPTPAFAQHTPDLEHLKKSVKDFQKYKNVILIANGGSRTSAYAFYHSLFEFRNNVNFEFLTSPEPEWINRLRKSYSTEDTLILPISKSGDNINSIEPILCLAGYPALMITGEKESTLSNIAKAMNWPVILHPEVGGRYSGLTSCGLAPAALMGLDIKEIYAGAQQGYEKYDQAVSVEKNDALKLAAYFFQLEEAGLTEIFTGIYSTALSAFLPLLIQLIHESCGKDGKGQTIFGDYSPESQHHTNQRFFGGRKNVIGLFMQVENSQTDFPIEIPENLKNIEFKGQPLSKLDGLMASQTMKFDLQGVLENAIRQQRPAALINVDKVNPQTMGEFIVFWQYFAMYSAMLRNQNPFDQPEVEDSKLISLQLTMNR